jgi:hypothetical protein
MQIFLIFVNLLLVGVKIMANNAPLNMYSDSSLKQDYLIRNVAQLGNIITVANQTVFAFTT